MQNKLEVEISLFIYLSLLDIKLYQAQPNMTHEKNLKLCNKKLGFMMDKMFLIRYNLSN